MRLRSKLESEKLREPGVIISDLSELRRAMTNMIKSDGHPSAGLGVTSRGLPAV